MPLLPPHPGTSPSHLALEFPQHPRRTSHRPFTSSCQSHITLHLLSPVMSLFLLPYTLSYATHHSIPPSHIGSSPPSITSPLPSLLHIAPLITCPTTTDPHPPYNSHVKSFSHRSSSLYHFPKAYHLYNTVELFLLPDHPHVTPPSPFLVSLSRHSSYHPTTPPIFPFHITPHLSSTPSTRHITPASPPPSTTVSLTSCLTSSIASFISTVT